MTWIQTYTGRKFDLAKPRAQDVDIRDIAHALSHLCRFTGHTREFYSVAQHSVLASCYVGCSQHVGSRRVLMLRALLHDAHEAYIGDISRPMKSTIKDLNDWPTINAVGDALFPSGARQVSGTDTGLRAIKEIDTTLLLSERDALMVPFDEGERDDPRLDASGWPQGQADERIVAYLSDDANLWEPKLAKRLFLFRYMYLVGEATTQPDAACGVEDWISKQRITP